MIVSKLDTIRGRWYNGDKGGAIMGVLEQFNGYLMSRDDVLAIIEGGQITRVVDAARLRQISIRRWCCLTP